MATEQVVIPLRPEPERDRYGRYLLPDPQTGRTRSWTRATTWSQTIADTFALTKWQMRNVAIGLSRRPDLVAQVATVVDPDNKDQKRKLDIWCQDAQEHAGASTRSNLGTALHSFLEHVDMGRDIHVPAPWSDDVDAYQQALAEHQVVISKNYVERICVNKYFQIAGTMDRLARLPDHELPIVMDLKGLALDTPIPTPRGWTTMGNLRMGDVVFDLNGRPCFVTAKSRVKQIGTYIVRFDDGAQVVCDTEHIWWTETGYQKRRRSSAKSIQEVRSTLVRNGQKAHRVPVAGSLELPWKGLPIDPYLLGCWLGDGAVRSGAVTRTVLGFGAKLRAHGLTYNKHIPPNYLRASHFQRLRLLQGLMDTDGTWNTARHRATFTTTDQALACQVQELLRTLGQRPHLASVLAHGFGKEVMAYHVEFLPVDLNPFRLPRKADQAAANTTSTSRANRRVIVAVEPGPDVPTACIAVDSPSRTYLCGQEMIPTHNTGRDLAYSWTEIAIQLAIYAHADYVYEVETDNYRPMLKVDRDYALVVHLPAGQARCTLYKVNVREGWKAVNLCGLVREWRKRKDLATVVRKEEG